jgi:hypothetical protein
VGESFLLGQGTGLVPATFFRVPISARVAFLALEHAKDAVVALMSFLGFIVLVITVRKKNREIYEKLRFFAVLYRCNLLVNCPSVFIEFLRSRLPKVYR